MTLFETKFFTSILFQSKTTKIFKNVKGPHSIFSYWWSWRVTIKYRIMNQRVHSSTHVGVESKPLNPGSKHSKQPLTGTTVGLPFFGFHHLAHLAMFPSTNDFNRDSIEPQPLALWPSRRHRGRRKTSFAQAAHLMDRLSFHKGTSLTSKDF